MRVEAGMADANSAFVPDDSSSPSNPGGDLTFAIENTSDVPLAVTQIDVATTTCGNTQCPLIRSNKNGTGAFVVQGVGDCKQYVTITSPTGFPNWPIIAPHSTLQVNGTDNNRLGAGMSHLAITAVVPAGKLPTATVQPTSIKLEWAPSTYLSGREVASYVVRRQAAGSKDSVQVCTVPAPLRACEDSPPAGQPVVYTVVAAEQLWRGPASAQSSPVTLAASAVVAAAVVASRSEEHT